MYQINPRWLALAVAAFLICACDQNLGLPPAGSSSKDSFNLPNSSPDATLNAFKTTLHPLMAVSCGGCHGRGQQPLHSVNDAQKAMLTIVENDLVNFNDPADSRIISKIRGGHNGLPLNLADQLQTQIIAWIADANVPTPQPGPAPGPNPGPILNPLLATYSSISKSILVPKCMACHSATVAAKGVRLDVYSNVMLQVKAGNANRSKLIQVTTSEFMPPGADKLTPTEIAIIRFWIENGALNN